MKTEINIENKARFIALYTPYGEIWKKSNEGHQLKVATGNICLNLKSLSSITEQDLLELADFAGLDNEELDKNWRDGVNEIVDHFNDEDAFLVLGDYFRYRGYAIPWMGITVDEQIKAGWIKLID